MTLTTLHCCKSLHFQARAGGTLTDPQGNPVAEKDDD